MNARLVTMKSVRKIQKRFMVASPFGGSLIAALTFQCAITARKGPPSLELIVGRWSGATVVRLELFEQPDSRESPVAFHRSRRDAERRSNLLDGKAAEVSQFDNLRL